MKVRKGCVKTPLEVATQPRQFSVFLPPFAAVQRRKPASTRQALTGKPMSYEEFYTNCLDSAMGGRKARRVPPEEFLAMHLNLPTLAEQKKIAAVLNTADQEVVHLKDQLAALRRQKQGLMQVLLTGKVRVKG